MSRLLLFLQSTLLVNIEYLIDFSYSLKHTLRLELNYFFITILDAICNC